MGLSLFSLCSRLFFSYLLYKHTMSSLGYGIFRESGSVGKMWPCNKHPYYGMTPYAYRELSKAGKAKWIKQHENNNRSRDTKTRRLAEVQEARELEEHISHTNVLTAAALFLG